MDEIYEMFDSMMEYHRDQCIKMHGEDAWDKYRYAYAKAEAARELIRKCAERLPSELRKEINEAISQKINACFESMFFSHEKFERKLDA